MLDLIAIAQSAPGAIAVNGAIVVGYKLAGISGALVAIIATILPPFLILTVLSFLYERFRSNLLLSQLLAGMQAGVGAVIASVVWDMGTDAVRQKKYSVDRNHAWCVSGCLLFPCERRLHYSLLYCARYCPDAACTQEEPEMITLQLFSEFSADRPVQLRRRLRGDAASSGAACCPERLAERTGICRSCDHCGNDARSDRGERGDLRRHKACWAPGALAATAGVILPACILVTCIARLYLKYRNLSILQGILGTLRPAVVAMIASAGVLLLVNAFWDGGPVTLAETNWTMLLLFAGCLLLLLRKTKLSPILIMVLAGVINVVKAVLAG